MKRILFLCSLIISQICQAQRISDLPIYINDGDSAYVAASIYVGGTYQTRKMYARDLVRKLLDSINQALNDKLSATFTINGYPLSGPITLNKSDIGLTFAENTADLDKPISTLTQNALDDKVDKVDGQALSDRNYTEADSLKVSSFPEHVSDSLANKQNKGLNASKGLIIGDSESAAGWGGTRLDSLILTGSDTAIGNTITNQAVGGHTILQQQTAYLADGNRALYDWVIVHIGLNDIWNYSESAATALGRYQTLINNIRSNSPKATIIAAAMQPVRKSYFSSFSNANALTAYGKWYSMNQAIMGVGSNKITGVDYRIDEHSKSLGDSLGNLVPIYNVGDDIHTNTRGRKVVASIFRKALNQAGYLNNRTFAQPSEHLSFADSNTVDLKTKFLRLGNVKLINVLASSSPADSAAYLDRATGLVEMRPVAGSGVSGDITVNSVTIASASSATSDDTLASFRLNSGVLRTWLSARGTQSWFLNNASSEVGRISYGTPGGTPGFIFYNSSGTGRTQMRQLSSTGGFAFGVTTGSSNPTDHVVFTSDQKVGIGTTTPNTSTILDVVSTTKGVRLSPMTSTERNAISSVAEGLLVYNLTSHKYSYHNGTAWTDLDAGSSTLTLDAVPTNGNTANAVSSDGVYDAIENAKVAPGITQTIFIPAGSANSTTSYADITGSSYTLASSKTYRFKYTVWYTAGTPATTGARFSINGPTFSVLNYYSQNDTDAGLIFKSGVQTYNSTAISFSAGSLATSNRAVVEGIVTTSASGSLILRSASEVAGQAITIINGWLELTEAP